MARHPSGCYPRLVIRDVDAYRKLDEREHWSRLEQMSIDESLAVGEALLTSELMDLAVFADDDHPVCLSSARVGHSDGPARGVTARTRSSFDAFCRDGLGFLDSRVRHLVIGGLSVIAVGETRTTADTQVTLCLKYQAQHWVEPGSG